jgi:hypothetical protein
VFLLFLIDYNLKQQILDPMYLPTIKEIPQFILNNHSLQQSHNTQATPFLQCHASGQQGLLSSQDLSMRCAVPQQIFCPNHTSQMQGTSFESQNYSKDF